MKSTETVTIFPLESSVGIGDLNALFYVLDNSLNIHDTQVHTHVGTLCSIAHLQLPKHSRKSSQCPTTLLYNNLNVQAHSWILTEGFVGY